MTELNLSESVLNRRVFNQGIYDLHSSQFMLGQTEKFIDKDMAVIDVGAAVGMYSHFWSQLASEVYSFEAVEPVYRQLQKTAENNPNMYVFNKAVGNMNGKTTFYVDDKRLSNSGFSDLVGGQAVEVEVITLDSFFDEYTNIGFIKIDVEGHELDVLKGAEKLIQKCAPTIMCEIYPKFNNGPVADTFAFLMYRGYRCFYNIKGSGLREIENIDHGVQVASNDELIAKHDGDFLFVYDN